MTSPKISTLHEKPTIGWIGTGVMGRSMCGHLLQQGFPVFVYNRSVHKATDLINLGAKWVNSAAEVASLSQIVFTMVGYPHEVEATYFGEQGIFKGCSPGVIFVDMSTSAPGLASRIAQEANALRCFAFDAPVSGGDVGAKNATLSIMVGGESDYFPLILPYLQIMGKNVVYQGAAGYGQHTKLVNQIVIAGTMIGVCESLIYAHRMGLNLESMLESIRQGAASCWTLQNLVPRMLVRDFEPGFLISHFVKDMELALAEARRLDLVLPGLALVHQLYLSLKAHGHANKGTQALLLALENLSQTEVN